MTETTAHNAFATASPRLERPSGSAFRGVARALARTTGTDVVLWRVLFVVLTFFNGLGAVLYLIGLVTIPREGEPQSLAERLMRGPDRHLRRADIVVLLVLALATAGLTSNADSLLAVAVLAGVGLLYLRSRTTTPTAATPATPATPAPTVASAQADTAVPPSELTSWSPPPPRPKSVLGNLTASAAVLVSGVLVLLRALGVDGITMEVVLASALAVVGLGLVAGAWWGRSRGLVVLALVLGLTLAGTLGARPVLDAGVGERTWHPSTSGSYRLGMGEATLDLRDLPVRESGTSTVTARVDIGHLVVLVPDGVRISLDAKAQLGDLLILGSDTNGRDISRHAELGGAGAPQLRLDLSVRTGQVEVRRG